MNSKFFTFLSIIFILCAQIVAAQGIKKTESLDSILRNIKDPNEKVDLIIQFLDKPENYYADNAIDFANRAYLIAEQNNYALGKVRAMLNLGNYYLRGSDYKKAMEYAQKSREMAEDLDFKKELANSNSIIGLIYNELGDYDNCSQYFFKGLKIYEEIEDKKGISRSLGDIGMNFLSQQDNKMALEYFNKSLSIAININYLPSVKRQYNNIAAVYATMKEYDKAISYLRKALDINIQLGDKLGQGTNMLNIGYIQMNEGNYDDALKSFQQSLDLVTELNNFANISKCNLNFGYCYYSAKKIDESIIYFKQALQNGQTQGYYSIINQSAKMLCQIYTDKKDTLKAFKYLFLEKNSLDSLYKSQKQDLLVKHELQYKYEKMKHENELSQKTKNIFIIIIIFSLVSGLIILTLVFSKYRLKSRFVVIEKEKIELEKEKIESELINKDKELTVNLISLIKKNEILSEISEKLVQLKHNTKGTEAKEIITKISKQLINTNDDKMFYEFSIRFQEVHAGFYEKLLKTYPDLTQNELKLCAFLRLNMSTKDIAELTNQQIDSIAKARHRLRKKLAITGSDTNLVTFLAQI